MMLAKRGDASDISRLQDDGWLFDLKVDGVRCQAEVVDGMARLTSRQDVNMTSSYPEVVEALERRFPRGRFLLDGELAVCDKLGLPSWPLTHKRAAQQRNPEVWARKLPAQYFAFDALTVDGGDLRREPFAVRRQALEVELHGGKDHLYPVLHTSDGAALWSIVRTRNLEGIIAKRASSRYVDGASDAWLKIKRTQSVSCLVGGTDPTTAARPFGALHLYLVGESRDGKTADLVPVGKVGTGFSDREASEVMQRLHHPPTIVEVTYLDVSPDGKLRQAVFQRLRDDQTIHDCTLDQIG